MAYSINKDLNTNKEDIDALCTEIIKAKSKNHAS